MPGSIIIVRSRSRSRSVAEQQALDPSIRSGDKRWSGHASRVRSAYPGYLL